MSKKLTSYEKQLLLTEAWRQYNANGTVDEGIMDKLKGLGKSISDKNPFSALKRLRQPTKYDDFEDDGTPSGELLPGDDPTTSGDDGAGGADAGGAGGADAGGAGAGGADAGGDVMPISGTEFATMNFLVKNQLLNIIKKAANVGVAAKDPESRNLQQNFNKIFFPALVKMTKNPNIDIAEGIDMDQFLQEMLIEAYGAEEADREPLTKRQQAAKKAASRARGGMKNYLKSAGGKPPIIANKIARALTQALTKDANPDTLLDAAAEVSSTIKDPKEKAQYEKRYEDSLMKNPQGRVTNYKQNVAAFVGAVTKIASAAAAKALADGSNFAADKASATAAARRPAKPKSRPEPARRTGGAALDRMRNRKRSGPTIAGVTAEGVGDNTISENAQPKWRIDKNGAVTRVNNEKK